LPDFRCRIAEFGKTLPGYLALLESGTPLDYMERLASEKTFQVSGAM